MRRWVLPFLGLGCLSGLLLACYGRAIVGGEPFAYRDAGHYYYPLHQRVQAEWEAGRWPLWEPEENGGMPLLGNPTAAVLYPGKLVFACVAYPLAARLYVVGHTLLAFAAMFVLLRHWGIGGAGATLGGLAYAFGGPVLFQSCNIIYLVGAAWLPLGFRAADRWLRLGRRIALAELAVVLAMETLGGDPESAYLTGVCAAAYAAALAWPRRRGTARGVPRAGLIASAWVVATLAAAVGTRALRPVAWTPWIGPATVVSASWCLAALVLLARRRRARRGEAGVPTLLVPKLSGLVVAAAVAAAAAGAQLVPVLEFLGQTRRGAAGAWDRREIYAFSLQPFRLVEFLWPNVFGTPYRGNRLWLGAFPPGDADVQVWTPSLYLGGFTLLLALAGAWRRSGGGNGPHPEPQPWRAWMAAVAVVSLMGSFGEYGSPIRLARMVPGAAASDTAQGVLREVDGSFYGLLVAALPGFDRFRFPGKLLTLTVLALAALAAHGWDRLASGDPAVRRRVAAYSGSALGLTLAVLGLLIAGRGVFAAWLERRGLTSFFGPFDAAGAVAETRNGLVQAALVLSAGLALGLRGTGRRPSMAAALVLAVTTLDLAWANARLVLTVPQSVLDATPEVVSILERAERATPGLGPYRIHRAAIWSPMAWRETPSPDRVGEFVAWGRRTAEPKYGITQGLHYTRTLGAAELAGHERFFAAISSRASPRAARALGVTPGTGLLAYSRRAFDLWNTRYFVLPFFPQWGDMHRGIASFVDRTERIHPPPDAFEGKDAGERALAWLKNPDYQVRRNLDALPRAWAVHEARWVRTAIGPGGGGVDPAIEEMLFSNDLSWPDPGRAVYDPRLYAWLDDADRPELAAYLPGDYPSAGEAVRVVHLQADEVVIDAELERPGIVVLADVEYPGWRLTLDDRAAPIYRVNARMRGAAVPAGRHRLVYRYRPGSLRLGLMLSSLGLTALVFLVVWSTGAAGPAQSVDGAAAAAALSS
jgi:hypothetical protein